MILQLQSYLRRIDYGGPLSPTRQTLHNLHRAHLLAIPFENVDVQLGIVPSLYIDALFKKLVVQRRGGWCFEMNLIFAWALRTIGMRVDLVGAVVDKHAQGSPINHLALLVHFDEPYLADVGFGNGFLTPTPLREGTFNDGRFDFRLERHGERWRFYNHKENGSTYDISTEPVEMAQIETANRRLATTSESPFVQTLLCLRLTDDGMVTLTNVALQVYSAKKIVEETATTPQAFAHMLREHFALDIDRIDALWPRVTDQHKRWLQKRIRGF